MYRIVSMICATRERPRMTLILQIGRQGRLIISVGRSWRHVASIFASRVCNISAAQQVTEFRADPFSRVPICTGPRNSYWRYWGFRSQYAMCARRSAPRNKHRTPCLTNMWQRKFTRFQLIKFTEFATSLGQPSIQQLII